MDDETYDTVIEIWTEEDRIKKTMKGHKKLNGKNMKVEESEQQKICETGIYCKICPYRDKCGAAE